MRLGSEGQTKLSYQAHYVVDGGKGRVILNVLVTPSEVTENRPMLDLLWRTAFRWRLWPDHITGAAKYGTRENVTALEKAGIRAYVAIPNFDFRDTGLFGPGHFRYDPENDHYLCPAGQTLRCHNQDYHNRRKRYRTGRSPRSATPASSKRSAPPASAGAGCTDRSTRTSTTGCAATAGLSPTRKPYGREGCGSSRCLLRLRIGTG